MIATYARVEGDAGTTDAVDRLKTLMRHDVLLEAMRSRWNYAQTQGFEVLDCELIRIHPRGDDEFVLEYDVRLRNEDGEHVQPVTVELLGEGAEQRWRDVVLSLQKSRRKQLKAGNAEVYVSCFAELGVVLRFPALDEKLVGLKLFHKPKVAAQVLAPYMSEGGGGRRSLRVELLGHRLGRRCIARFRGAEREGTPEGADHRSLIAKMYKTRGGRGKDIARIMLWLRESGLEGDSGCSVPAPLAYLEDWQTLLMEDVPGAVLADLEGDAAVVGVVAASRCISRLHALTLDLQRFHTVDDEFSLLRRWVGLVGRVHEDMREPVRCALARVHVNLERSRNAPQAVVHRDFYDKQVLIAEDRTVLIDFDTLCCADPAIDIGNFLAHCRLRAIQGLTSSSGIERVFLEAYSLRKDCERKAGGVDFETRVGAYRDAALLRLACLYAFWPKWRHVSMPLLEGI